MPKPTGSVGAAFVGRPRGRGRRREHDERLRRGPGLRREAARWSQLPALPAARHGVAVTALKNSLYAIGGAAAAGHTQSTKKTYVLDFDCSADPGSAAHEPLRLARRHLAMVWQAL